MLYLILILVLALIALRYYKTYLGPWLFFWFSESQVHIRQRLRMQLDLCALVQFLHVLNIVFGWLLPSVNSLFIGWLYSVDFISESSFSLFYKPLVKLIYNCLCTFFHRHFLHDDIQPILTISYDHLPIFLLRQMPADWQTLGLTCIYNPGLSHVNWRQMQQIWQTLGLIFQDYAMLTQDRCSGFDRLRDLHVLFRTIPSLLRRTELLKTTVKLTSDKNLHPFIMFTGCQY